VVRSRAFLTHFAAASVVFIGFSSFVRREGLGRNEIEDSAEHDYTIVKELRACLRTIDRRDSRLMTSYSNYRGP
jgi:hypothetical protein